MFKVQLLLTFGIVALVGAFSGTTFKVSKCFAAIPSKALMGPRSRLLAFESGADEEELSDEELEVAMGEWDDRIAQFNTVHLTGRLGSDPEPRYFDDGKVVVNLSLASKRKIHYLERKMENIKSGEEETDWYGLEIWGQTAEFCAKYCDKGARVGVVGTLQIDRWVDKVSGEPRSRAKVIVRDLDLLETRAEAESRRSNRRGPSFIRDEDDTNYSQKAGGTGGFFDN